MTQTRNKIFDDFSQLFTNAMGVAQGARSEAETAMKSWIDRWIAERNLVTREEFEVVRDMAVKAREENEALLARIAVLERAVGGTGSGGTGLAGTGVGGTGVGGTGVGGTGVGGTGRPAPVDEPGPALDAQDATDAPLGAKTFVDPDAPGKPAAEDSDHFERPDGSVQS